MRSGSCFGAYRLGTSAIFGFLLVNQHVGFRVLPLVSGKARSIAEPSLETKVPGCMLYIPAPLQYSRYPCLGNLPKPSTLTERTLKGLR